MYSITLPLQTELKCLASCMDRAILRIGERGANSLLIPQLQGAKQKPRDAISTTKQFQPRRVHSM